MESTLLILHLLGVVAWLGGSLATGSAWMRSISRSDTELLVATENVKWMSRWIAMPASMVVLLAGGALVSAADWDWSFGWIHAGTGLLVAAALVGVAVIAPATRRLAGALQSGGRDSDAVARMRLGLISVQAMLVIAVWAMVVKPF